MSDNQHLSVPSTQSRPSSEDSGAPTADVERPHKVQVIAKTDSAQSSVDMAPGQKEPTSLTSERDMRTAWELTTAMDIIRGGEYHTNRAHRIGTIVTSWETGDWVQDFKDPKDNKRILHTLSAARKATLKATRTYAYGRLTGHANRFSLRVTYPGCEFEADDLSSSMRGDSVIEKVLQRWLQHAPVSGFGDNRPEVMQTRVDDTVRKASEIPREFFEVDPKVIAAIGKLWSKKLLPSRVRVEPYKIHIYGTGGHFKPHKDTPEGGLVGTFLLGIGDTTCSDSYPNLEYEAWDGSAYTTRGNFCIDGIRRAAHPGHWVAFYPDIPHSVCTIEKGERAVIAFKIFAAEAAPNETSIQFPALVDSTRAALDMIPIPFGLILDHEYPMGTTVHGLKGTDAVTFAACRQLQSSPLNSDTEVTHVEIIPVIVTVTLEKMNEYSEEVEDPESNVWTHVYSFTAHDVDLVLAERGPPDDPEVKRRIAKAQSALQWLRGSPNDVNSKSNTPRLNSKLSFFSSQFERHSSAFPWSSHSTEINWTGNESDGDREDSVYLAYAIVVLGKGGGATSGMEPDASDSDEE